MTIMLASLLDTAAAGPLRQTLRKALGEEGPLALDGSGVERAGQASLQVLAAAAAAAAAAGREFRIVGASPVLTEMAGLAGLPSLVA